MQHSYDFFFTHLGYIIIGAVSGGLALLLTASVSATIAIVKCQKGIANNIKYIYS